MTTKTSIDSRRASKTKRPPTEWWRQAVVYQIYPRSFKDSNGDGIGDLRGILSKLDYLKWLGVDVLWLSPIYQSPNRDNGYDISDYQAIMNEFGTMEDFDILLREVHARGMRLLMDLVVNHTSDEHPWFIASCLDAHGPYRNFYIWRPGVDGKPPNNWASFFGGSVWERHPATEQYYLHLFAVQQPDLNWEYPPMRQAIYAMMRWWLNKGVDGFRMDVINAIAKAPGLPNAPGERPWEWGGAYFLNRPEVHAYLQEMRDQVLASYDVMTVGETLDVAPEQALQYVGFDRGELDMVFQFELMDIDAGPEGKWDVRPWQLSEFKRIVSRWQTGLHGRGWNSLYLNNHDQPRMVSRFGHDGIFRAESAKMLATLLHTLQGTPFIYQGEEIGMTNARFDTIDAYRDIETLNWYAAQIAEPRRSPADVMDAIYAKGRDNARTPMQWTAEAQAGFTTGEPWLTVNPNYRQINVESQRTDPDSVLAYYRRLIALRRQYPVIIHGDYTLVDPENERTYAFMRAWAGDCLVTILNFGQTPQTFRWPAAPAFPAQPMRLVLSNYSEVPPTIARVMSLRPFETRVYVAVRATRSGGAPSDADDRDREEAP